MPKKLAIANIRNILNDRRYHSEEVSETDVEKAEREREDGVRQKSDKNDRVIKVLDKNWHSSEVRSIFISVYIINLPIFK